MFFSTYVAFIMESFIDLTMLGSSPSPSPGLSLSAGLSLSPVPSVREALSLVNTMAADSLHENTDSSKTCSYTRCTHGALTQIQQWFPSYNTGHEFLHQHVERGAFTIALKRTR